MPTSSTLTTGTPTSPAPVSPAPPIDAALLANVETQLQLYLSDVTLNFPLDGSVIHNHVISLDPLVDKNVPFSVIKDLLQKFAAQQLIRYIFAETIRALFVKVMSSMK